MLTGFDLCRAAMAVEGITAPEKSVLMVLAIMADKDDATCFPPVTGSAGLTAKTCLSERSVQRSIQRLKDLGHISRKQLRHGCVYTVHPVSLTPATETGDSVTGDTLTPATQAPTPATVAPKLPVTTIPQKATPSSVKRAPKLKLVPFRLPDDWKPVRFADGTVAREVIDRRGREWGRAALESFRHWAANAKDEDGKGRKLDWQAAWAKWVIRQDSDDGQRNGTGSYTSAGNDGLGVTARAVLAAVGGC